MTAWDAVLYLVIAEARLALTTVITLFLSAIVVETSAANCMSLRDRNYARTAFWKISEKLVWRIDYYAEKEKS